MLIPDTNASVLISAQPSKNFVVFSDTVEFESFDAWNVQFNKETKRLVVNLVNKKGSTDPGEKNRFMSKPTTKKGALSKPHLWFDQVEVFGKILPACSKKRVMCEFVQRARAGDTIYNAALVLDLSEMFETAPEENKLHLLPMPDDYTLAQLKTMGKLTMEINGVVFAL